MNEESNAKSPTAQENSWRPNPLGEAAKSWSSLRAKYTTWMWDAGLEYEIDEFALVFPHKQLLLNWVEEAVREDGVTLFNTATDRVHTHPFCTDYGVEYWFLQREGDPWRVEAMTMRYGVSPLHAGFLESMKWQNLPRMIHMSFKVENEAAYKEAVALFEEGGAVHAQTCDSTYGTFSYWRVPADEVGDDAFVYLKPRVNTRDQEVSLEPTSGEDKATPDRGKFGMPTIGNNIRGLFE